MRIINVVPEMDQLQMGKQGENKSTKFLFDVSDWLEKYPGCTITLVNRRPNENSSYPCVLTTEEDGRRGWVINSADLAIDGKGECELKCTLDDMIEKDKRTWKTKIKKSLSGDGNAPEPWESLMDDIEALVGDAQDAAEDAETAVEHYPKIEDGYWYVWDGTNEEWVNTGVQAQGPQGQTGQTGPAGSDGADGDDGADGVTFTPSVDTDGYISWTNDGGKENPTTRNIRGPQGETGETGPAGADGTDATPDLITSDYSDLTFPVAAGTMCYHSGVLYKANQNISTSEDWTAAHWTATTVEAELSAQKTEITNAQENINNTDSNLNSLAINGFYNKEAETGYVSLTSGGISSSGNVGENNKKGYVWINPADESNVYTINTVSYKYNLCYVDGETVTKYTTWLYESPIVFDNTEHTKIGISVMRISEVDITNELNSILQYTTSLRKIGNLATKDYVDKSIPKGTKCIYPDGFVSRIKPDIYLLGKYIADINIDNYKISGSGDVWVSTDGNDTTGTGEESKPYATVTKALTTSAKTIHIKAGTYLQGTHYSNYPDIAGRNLIGHGEVTFEHDSSGHYMYASSSAYIENVTFKGGNASSGSAFIATCSASGKTVCFVDCTFESAGEQGLAVTGIDAVLVNCIAYGNRLDGFNYHKVTDNGTTYIPNVLEIDCVAYDNGDASVDSCNGSTAHDGVQIVRLNCEYYSCHGGVVAEIGGQNEGNPTTKSINFGVLSHDSTGYGTYAASFWASYNTEMYLYNCKSFGSTYDITALNDGKVVVRNLETGADNVSAYVEITASVDFGEEKNTHFRKIAEVTTENNQQTVRISTDLNGNAFSLKEIVVYIETTASSGGSDGYVIVNKLSGSPSSDSCSVTVPGLFNASSATKKVANCMIRGGRFFGESHNNNASNYYSPIAMYTSKNAMGLIACESIESIKIGSLNDHTFGDGSVITVYGR